LKFEISYNLKYYHLTSSVNHIAMTEGQSTPQQGPAATQAPLKSQKITDIIDAFRPSKVGSSAY
jgi:hypothetical protein